MAEIDHLLSLEDGEIVTFTDAATVTGKVNMWLDTPKGQYWGRPEWGHRLNDFRHEPLSDLLEVEMENVIMLDLERDLVGVKVYGIKVKALEIDQFEISINTNFGQFSRPLNL